MKYGSKVPTVPLLFSSTNNEEFTSSLGGETMVLAKLLLDIGISLTGCCDLYSGSVCRPCARKICSFYMTRRTSRNMLDFLD